MRNLIFGEHYTVPVQHFSPGMYVFSVKSSHGKEEKGKIVKQ
jgi:hypothetical protein